MFWLTKYILESCLKESMPKINVEMVNSISVLILILIVIFLILLFTLWFLCSSLKLSFSFRLWLRFRLSLKIRFTFTSFPVNIVIVKLIDIVIINLEDICLTVWIVVFNCLVISSNHKVIKLWVFCFELRLFRLIVFLNPNFFNSLDLLSLNSRASSLKMVYFFLGWCVENIFFFFLLLL